MTLTNAEGERNTMNVPPDVKAFETLKVGDRVDVDYRESIAVSMAPAGAKPGMVEKSVGSPMGASSPGEPPAKRESPPRSSRSTSRTTRSPSRDRRVTTRRSPSPTPAIQKKLPNLKPGQVVQFTYTEAIAVGIRPAPVK